MRKACFIVYYIADCSNYNKRLQCLIIVFGIRYVLDVGKKYKLVWSSVTMLTEGHADFTLQIAREEPFPLFSLFSLVKSTVLPSDFVIINN